jgi:hypothetical protein
MTRAGLCGDCYARMVASRACRRRRILPFEDLDEFERRIEGMPPNHWPLFLIAFGTAL